MTPRIDPLKLLTCLKVLLAPNGGINSENEVKRLAGLMAKYSKKLVSKCIYIQILKCTKTDLLGAFMGSGGWSLTHMWLSDGIRTLNWPLVQEILELLLLCPVDIQRLRSNSAPKLVKGLSKDGGNEGVRILASKLVEQWLKVVKGETTSIATVTLPIVAAAGTDIKSNTTSDQNKSHLATYGLDNTNIPLNATQSTHANSLTTSDQDPLALTSHLSSTDPSVLQSPTVAERATGDSGLVYKFILKDGKQVLAKIDSGSTAERKSSTEISSEERTSSPHAINQEEKDEDSKTSSEGSKSDKSSVKDNEKDKSKETESKIKDSKDKDKEKSRSSKDKDKHRDHKSSSSSHKSSSSSKSSSKSSSSSSASKSKSSSSSSSSSRKLSTDSRSKDKEREKDRDSEKDKSKSDKEKHRSSSSKSSSSSSSSSSKDKHRDRDRDRSSKDKDKEKDKEKEKDKSKDKEKEKIKDKDDKSEQSDSEKPVLPSIDKLGKIPKKKDDGSSSPSATVTPTSITIPSKKASMSIEIRRDTERPKTVKTYKSQFRSHGLTDEAPPPPSRKGLKKPVSQSIPGTAIFSTISFKRPSPPPQPASSPATTVTKELEPPAEKKLKIDLNPPPSNPANEKPGAIKLIAPKAKPSTLIESDMFMDALSASALPKKDSKKRKRRASGSKDKENSTASPPQSPVAAKAAPLKFYQDTLEDKEDDRSDNVDEIKDDEKKDDDEKKEDEDDIPLKRVKEQIEEEVRQEKEGGNGKSKDDVNEEEDDEPVVKKPPGPGCGPDGPPGVLMFHRRKGPKKKLTWKSEDELESIRYFELDETERVNVTKTFNEMKNMDRFNEREAFLLARKLNCEDVMTEQTHWMPLILVDDVPPHPEGSQSKEKKIQAEREQTTLKALYFNRHMIPDSPSEPDMEQYQITEPAVIPLDDITGNPDAVNDFTNMPWPDPKGSPPHNVPDDFLGGPDMGFPPGQFNPFMQFGQPGWQMGPGNGPSGPPNGVMPPNLMGGPPMGPPPMSGPNMGPPMGGFNNMNMGPGPQNMGGPPPAPPSLLMGPPEPDDIGLMKSMNMIPPFGGPNFIPGPNQGFNNFGPPNMPNMPNMGMNPNSNMNMNRNMDNGPNNRNHNNNNRGNWRSGSAGPPPRDPGLGSWRPQGPSNNRNWAHGGSANNRICKAFQRGFCRNGNNCNYMHPPTNY